MCGDVTGMMSWTVKFSIEIHTVDLVIEVQIGGFFEADLSPYVKMKNSSHWQIGVAKNIMKCTENS